MADDETKGASVRDDVQAFVTSSAIDNIAAYAARGRAYRDLSEEQLIEQWCVAFEAMAVRPLDPATIGGETDLASEFALRGIERPWALVSEAVNRYFENSEREIAAGEKTNPGAAKEIAKAAVEAFKKRRKNSS